MYTVLSKKVFNNRRRHDQGLPLFLCKPIYRRTIGLQRRSGKPLQTHGCDVHISSQYHIFHIFIWSLNFVFSVALTLYACIYFVIFCFIYFGLTALMRNKDLYMYMYISAAGQSVGYHAVLS